MTLSSDNPQELGLFSLLETHVAHTPDAAALTAPGRPILTYGRLWTALNDTVQTLCALGIERHDRVALVLPDGPEMAMAFLAVASSAICAPLNPAYRASEFAFYLSDLQAKAIILCAAEDAPIRAVARSQGIPLIELTPLSTAAAGLFSLPGDRRHAITRTMPQPHDVALVLHTSGTTARPKLVPLTHANLCHSARNIARTLALTAQDRCLNVMPLFHIHGLVGALLASLCAGASVVCTPGFHPLHFFSWLATCAPTWYTAVPTMHQAIVARAAQHRQVLQDAQLRFLRSSSAALPAQLMRELEDVFQAPVIEAYGMTEAAHQMASNSLPPGKRQAGSVGVAAGPEVTIMDDTGRALRRGAIGEIVIRGANVIAGYVNTPAGNAAAFHDDWFRTGDQGYIDPEGFIFVTGRLKEMINRGGEKIAPREVDEALMAHPAVAQAVAFPVPHPQLGEEVAVAVVLRPEARAAASELRAFAATRLADFKIPRRILVVESLPQNATGKLQRLGLAEKLGLTAQEIGSTPAEFVAPRTPLESALARIWAQVLGHDRVGSHDDFFLLGGDSILATQILARVRQAWQVDVSFLVFFEQPTVAGMASALATAPQKSPRPDLRAIPRDGHRTLSFAQQRLWFLDQLEPANTAYNRPVALRLNGTLNLTALEQSLHTVVQRHEVLRTTFPARHGQPVPVTAASLPIPLPVTDLSVLPAAERAAQAQELLVTASQDGFDLAQGPLLRAMLLRLHETEHLLLVVTHHIVFDGWSVSVLVHELATLYDAFCQNTPSVLPLLAIQYADCAHQQQERLQGPVLQQQLMFWQQQLGHHLPVLDLPTDRPRPPLQTLRGAQHTLFLPAALREALKVLSQQEGVTLFMTLLTAFQVLLQRYTAQDDIVVGVPVAGRNEVETEALIGVFVNSLVLRTDLAGNPSFREALQRLRRVAVQAYAHQDVPFEKLVEILQPQRDLSRTPLFQVMFQFRNLPSTTTEVDGLRIEEYEFDRQVAMFDMAVDIRERPSGLACVFEYNTDLFEAATIRAMAEHFQTLLAGIVAHPQQCLANLPLLTTAEQQQVLVEWNATSTPLPQSGCIHELFAAQAARTPDAVAVEDGEHALTYQALNQRANQLAHYLQRRGVGPEILVGLCVERCLDMLVGLLAILKAGGAYVPLDPTYPQERLAFMIQDTAVPIVLTQQRLRPALPAHHAQVLALDSAWPLVSRESQENPGGSVAAKNLAYVIYTSGSTGQPKGVMIEHQALLNYTRAANAFFSFGAQDRVLQFASLSFDVAAEEIFICLTHGGTLVLRPDNMLDTVPFFLKKCQELALTVLDLPTAYWHEITTAFATQTLSLPPAVRLVVMGGEKTTPEHLALWYQHVDQRVGLVHAYGPTEATVSATLWALAGAQAAGRHVPIGRPIQNMQAYVLDAHWQPVPIGLPGELYIGGVGLARGYLKRPALQATQFIPHPFCNTAEPRLYKTGDLVRWRHDGSLEFLSRGDSQVKIRGFRIEIGEIETFLHRHPAVRQALVIVRQDVPGQPRLLAYLVAHRCPRPAISEIRHYLQQVLPTYMIPAAFVWLEAFPLLPNGKVDQRGLPAPALTDMEPGQAFVGPQTIVEEILVRLWSSLLGVQPVGSHDNFFALGGHSLVAAQLMAHIASLLQVDLPLRQLFQTPTLSALAEAVLAHEGKPGQTQKIARILKHLVDIPSTAPHTAGGIAGFSPQVLALLPSFLTDEGLAIPPTIPRRDQTQPMPLSFAQQRLWFLDQFEPGKAFYNITVAYRLQGALQVTVLQQSLNDIMQRHEILRTAFTATRGQPVQTILPVASFPIQQVDLQSVSEADKTASALQAATVAAQQPFDLSSAPLCRAVLLQLAADDYVFVLILHHIIADGWSCNVFFDELTALYKARCAGEAAALPALPLQYADYAAWQHQWLQGEVLQQQLAYWRQQLAGSAPRLDLPTDHPRPAVQTFRGARQPFCCPSSLSRALKALSHQAEVTLFMTLLAALQTLLYRYSGQQDILIGSPIASRPQPALAGLIGFFVNTLVLRTTLAETLTFWELLACVREVALEAYAHQDLPFEKLVEALQPERHLSHSPFFQVMFAWQNQVPFTLPELTVMPLAIENGTAKFDMTLYMWEEVYTLQGLWEYNTHLFTPDTMTRFTSHFQTLLEGIAAHPEQAVATIPLLTPAERQQLLVAWNATPASYPRQACLHELFEQQVERLPDAIAVSDENTTVTYDELNRRANHLAHYLQERGVKPGTLVGICIERSVDMVLGILGILKAGAAYVPLDPTYPAERLAFMRRDARLPALLTRHGLLARLPAPTATVVCIDTDWREIVRRPPTNLCLTVQSESVAYAIYTSGSTGLPKGVLGLHRGAVNRAAWMWETYPFQPGEVCCQKTSLNFVDSVWEIFGPLLQGVPIVIIPDDWVKDPHRLVAALASAHVTRIVLVPSLLRMLFETFTSLKQHLAQLNLWISSGEALPIDLAQRFWQQMPQATLLNLYGSSEVAADATWCEVRHETALSWVPIGRPLANTQVYLLDTHGQPVPPGMAGEIYIGGDGLAGGYLHRPELTAARFLPRPFGTEPGTLLYKTGDMARYLPDGALVYLGRGDHQVKIRGVRVELAEIEAVLLQHPAIRGSVVLLRHESQATQRLVAYLVAAEDTRPGMAELRQFLQAKLPEVMIPEVFTWLHALPLTPNGKVDRQALPVPNYAGGTMREAAVVPQDALEARLRIIWEQVLGKYPIGVHDNFFTLGGHSLLAVRLIARLERAFQVSLPLASLFHAPTVAQFANLLRQSGVSVPQSLLLTYREGGTKPPFFCIHGVELLGRYLAADQPYYALYPHAFDGRKAPHTVEAMARDYLQEVQALQPEGPYFLGGGSLGGLVALEMAQMLWQQGQTIGFLALIDPPRPGPEIYEAAYRHYLKYVWRKTCLTGCEWYLGMGYHMPPFLRRPYFHAVNYHAVRQYVPTVYPGCGVLFHAMQNPHDPYAYWPGLLAGGLEVYDIPGNHLDLIFNEASVQILGESLSKALDAISIPQKHNAGDM